MRVHAHRGNTLTAGAVALAALLVELELRGGTAPDLRLALAAGLAGLALVGALASPVEDDGPRTYQEVLLALATLAGTATLAHVLVAAGVVPGPLSPPAAVAATAAAGALLGGLLARARGGTIVLAVVAALAVVAVGAATVGAWPGDDPRPGLRLALLVVGVLLVGQIVVRLERRYRQAIVLADVLAGVVLALAATFLVDDLPGATAALGLAGGEVRAGAGWALLLVAAGFGLVGVGSALHETGPGWLGALALASALAVLADHGSSAWPAALAVGGVVLVAVGLRPVAERAPLPPDRDEPDGDEPPPVPWPRPPLLVVAGGRADDDGAGDASGDGRGPAAGGGPAGGGPPGDGPAGDHRPAGGRGLGGRRPGRRPGADHGD